MSRYPDRWLYRRIGLSVKNYFESRRNAYMNYFQSLKCKSDYLPEAPCQLNKFEKIGIELAHNVREQLHKLFTRRQRIDQETSSFTHDGSYFQNLLDEHHKANHERVEYTKYIHTLDHCRQLEPFNEQPIIQKYHKMNRDYADELEKKRQEMVQLKMQEKGRANRSRQLLNEKLKEEIKEKIEADKRAIEAIEKGVDPTKIKEEVDEKLRQAEEKRKAAEEKLMAVAGKK